MITLTPEGIKKIISAIDKETSLTNQFIYNKESFQKILRKHYKTWGLPKIIKLKNIIQSLINENVLTVLAFKPYGYLITKYIWREPNRLDLASSFKLQTYFTHFTAMYLNNLTDQLPKTVYVNYEQVKKFSNNKNELDQKNIDLAFSKKPRICGDHRVIKHGNYSIMPLNGMKTNYLGVIQLYTNELQREVRVTNLERTLIDIAVRPQYSGGIHQILRAYKNAIDRVSINEICTMLRKLNYTYPYHQNIGFLLEKAGYSNLDRLEQLRKFGINYKFYLTYEMKETEFCDKWGIYYPKGF